MEDWSQLLEEWYGWRVSPQGCSTQETVGRSAPELRDLKGDPHHVIVGESPGDLLRLQPG